MWQKDGQLKEGGVSEEGAEGMSEGGAGGVSEGGAGVSER